MSDFDLGWLNQYFDETGLVVFDIGAFDGGDSVRFVNHPKVTEVHAFEASPRNFRYLEMLRKRAPQ